MDAQRHRFVARLAFAARAFQAAGPGPTDRHSLELVWEAVRVHGKRRGKPQGDAAVAGAVSVSGADLLSVMGQLLEKVDIVTRAVQMQDQKLDGIMATAALPTSRPTTTGTAPSVAAEVAPFFAQWRERAERLAEEAAT
eukprot:11713955-Prorocentrum_lima.AAC.1